jgi:hypothetical protein
MGRLLVCYMERCGSNLSLSHLFSSVSNKALLKSFLMSLIFAKNPFSFAERQMTIDEEAVFSAEDSENPFSQLCKDRLPTPDDCIQATLIFSGTSSSPYRSHLSAALKLLGRRAIRTQIRVLHRCRRHLHLRGKRSVSKRRRLLL